MVTMREIILDHLKEILLKLTRRAILLLIWARKVIVSEADLANGTFYDSRRSLPATIEGDTSGATQLKEASERNFTNNTR
jgi:hypothetical protein